MSNIEAKVSPEDVRRRLTCVIQARRDSTRIERKMTRPFAESCLLEIGLRKTFRSRFLDQSNIYLSACEDEIKAVGKKVGVKVYDRPVESTMEPIVPRLIWKYAFDIKTEYFIVLTACNPLLSIETIDRAIETFFANEHKSLFSVVRRRNFFFDKDSRPVNRFLGDPGKISTLDTKRIEPLYEAAHSIYIWSAKYMRENLAYWPFEKNDPFLFEIPEDEAFDIDYPWQFELAEAMYQRRKGAVAASGEGR